MLTSRERRIAAMPEFRFTLRNTLFALSVVFVFAIVLDGFSASHKSWSLAPPVAHVTHKNKKPATIGKLSMFYGERNPLYERALAAHKPHNELFGYSMYTLERKLLKKYWSKPAFFLQRLLIELGKPEKKRLKWLVWFDADIVIMNPKIPLEIFLPPKHNYSHINALVTNDHRGLNNGVFFLRVNEWSVWLMDACLGTEVTDPKLKLKHDDQSALEHWLEKDRFRNATMHVPQRWFNAYPGERGENGSLSDPMKPTREWQDNAIKEGDFVVHFAGHKTTRNERMALWMNAAEKHLPEWEVRLVETTYKEEIDDFWKNQAPHEREMVDARKAEKAEKKKKKKEKEEQEKAEKERLEKEEAEKDKPTE